MRFLGFWLFFEAAASYFSALRIISLRRIPRAAQIRSATSRVGCRFPRSIMLIYVRSTSANSASFSWVTRWASRTDLTR